VARGTLITIEGLDGAGKSTLASALAEELRRRGCRVELLRDPGGVEISERIRALVKDPELTVAPRAEALLYAAARAQLAQERIGPALAAGAVVLVDRFLDSSLAYQGAGREVGVERVRAVNEFGVEALRADRTLLLRVTAATRLARVAGRPEAPDRFAREDESFYATVADAYERLARAEPQRVRPIDAEQPPDAVLRDALAELADLGLGAV
jgi:dTMP kinase